MTNAECDLLIAISERPGRRMMVDDIKKLRGVDWRLLPSLIRENYLIFFHGGWVALTDAGYDSTIAHCAHNF
jgi:hypothetical protein